MPACFRRAAGWWLLLCQSGVSSQLLPSHMVPGMAEQPHRAGRASTLPPPLGSLGWG